ncbi:glycoside hydrolase family 32 protein, partial [Pseudomonas aeruginosa]
MNDPIPFFHDGTFHVFFQHNPNAPVWGDMHWGHAISKDLLHWTEGPIALFPDQPYDKDGVFTGSI